MLVVRFRRTREDALHLMRVLSPRNSRSTLLMALLVGFPLGTVFIRYVLATRLGNWESSSVYMLSAVLSAVAIGFATWRNLTKEASLEGYQDLEFEYRFSDEGVVRKTQLEEINTPWKVFEAC